jgi:hypothetical protein
MSMDGEGTFSADSTRGRMKGSMEIETQAMEFEGIAVDGVLYMRSDTFQLPRGKQWVKTEDPPTSTLSPSEFVRFLRESGSVENVGTEQIRGQETTHFRGPLDLERLAGEESGGELLERLRANPAADDIEMLVDVWVAPDGLPARLTLDISMPGQASGSMQVSADILEYDVEVDAEPPPADTVATGG